MLTTNTANLIILEQLAAQANMPELLTSGPSLPAGWVNLQMFNNSNALPNIAPVPTQGFLAKGPIDSSGTKVAVLALGMTWANYLFYQYDGTFPQSTLPVEIAGTGITADEQLMTVYVNAYQDLRANLWSALSGLGNVPLYICGMSLGGPVAQIAALDLRIGNTGPAGQNAPAQVSPCYVFSTGNIANQVMAKYYLSMVQTCNVVWAGTTTIPVDQFPLSPSDNDFSPLGTLVPVKTSLPAVDVPWWERSDVFYLQALGGTPTPVAPTPTTIPNPPAGFSQTLAYTLALLTQNAYQLTQHPDSTPPPVNFTLSNTINANGVPFAFIYTNTNTVAVIFRGCTTWQEFNASTANTNFTHPAFDSNLRAHVHSGAYAIYSAPVNSQGNAPVFSDTLNAAIKSIVGNKKLYVAGHSLGGALANIAAADYTIGANQLPLTAVYTFGSIMVADSDFSSDFNAALGNKSYQVIRLADSIATATSGTGYLSINNQVILNGELNLDESTSHSLYGYSALLNPSRSL